MSNKETENKMLTDSELRNLYRENVDFKHYVNKFAVHHNMAIHEAFKHKIVNYAAQNILGTLKVGDNLYV